MRLLFGVDSRKGTLNTRNPFTLKLSYLFFMFMKKKKENTCHFIHLVILKKSRCKLGLGGSGAKSSVLRPLVGNVVLVSVQV